MNGGTYMAWYENGLQLERPLLDTAWTRHAHVCYANSDAHRQVDRRMLIFLLAFQRVENDQGLLAHGSVIEEMLEGMTWREYVNEGWPLKQG